MMDIVYYMDLILLVLFSLIGLSTLVSFNPWVEDELRFHFEEPLSRHKNFWPEEKDYVVNNQNI